MFVWLLKIVCQTYIAFDQNKIIYDKKQKKNNLKNNYIFADILTHLSL
jgi:hypothetical protein